MQFFLLLTHICLSVAETSGWQRHFCCQLHRQNSSNVTIVATKFFEIMCEGERKQGGRIHRRRELKSTMFFPDILCFFQTTCLLKLKLNINCNTCAGVVFLKRRIKLPKPLLCRNLLWSSGIQNELSSNLVPLYSPLWVTYAYFAHSFI